MCGMQRAVSIRCDAQVRTQLVSDRAAAKWTRLELWRMISLLAKHGSLPYDVALQKVLACVSATRAGQRW